MTDKLLSQLFKPTIGGIRILFMSCLVIITFTTELLAQDILEATRSGDAAQVSALLKNDPTLIDFTDDGGWSPLRIAAKNNNIEMIKLLLAKGADIDKMAGDNTALFQAAVEGSVDALKALIAAGADIDIRNTNHSAPILASGRHIEVVILLLDAGADIDSHSGDGRTLLSQVTARGYKEVVNLLLARGAAVATEGWQGGLLIKGAIQHGLTTLLNRLITDGANINIATTEGGTMVHTAAIGGSTDVVRMLVDSDTEPDTKDRYGFTPLHYAALNGSADVINYLVSKGVEIDLLTLAGESPLSLANKYGHEESATALRAAGAVKENSEFPMRRGSYLGEELPNGEAKVFALGIVSSQRFEHSAVALSADGNEIVWSSGFDQPTRGLRLLRSTRFNDVWGEPVLIPMPAHGEPFYSTSGDRFYFLSRHPIEGETRPFGDTRIWYSDRVGDGWSDPIAVKGGPNNYQLWWNFSVADNGDIYFGSNASEGFGRTDIYVSRFKDGKYLPRENPGLNVNTKGGDISPYIAPDGSFLLFATDIGGGIGGIDIYVTWRQEDGSWGEAENLGPKVNSRSTDNTAVLSHDGKYLFFGSYRSGNRDNYWVDVASIPALNKL